MNVHRPTLCSVHAFPPANHTLAEVPLRAQAEVTPEPKRQARHGRDQRVSQQHVWARNDVHADVDEPGVATDESAVAVEGRTDRIRFLNTSLK